jgi:hypothetical protein
MDDVVEKEKRDREERERGVKSCVRKLFRKSELLFNIVDIVGIDILFNNIYLFILMSVMACGIGWV